MFLLFGSAEPQPWAQLPTSTNQTNPCDNNIAERNYGTDASERLNGHEETKENLMQLERKN